jgi:hypothetical protein
MRNRAGLILIIVTALAVIAACSSGPDDSGPGGTVQRFYTHLNDGDYAAAKALYNTEARTLLDDPDFSSEEGFRTWAEQHTRQGSIAEVRILSEETTEGEARVEFEIVFDDGATQAGQVTATLEEDKWKLGLLG